MSETTIEIVVGTKYLLTKADINSIAGEGDWSVDKEQTSPGILCERDEGEEAPEELTLQAEKEDIYTVVLVSGTGKEASIIFSATDGAVANEGDKETDQPSIEEDSSDSVDDQPDLPATDDSSEPDELAPETEVPEANDLVEPPVEPVEPTVVPEEPSYTPPTANTGYNPDQDHENALKALIRDLDEYKNQMCQTMVDKATGIRMQTRLFNTIKTVLSYGGRRTEVCMNMVLEEFRKVENGKSLYDFSTMMRFSQEAFGNKKERELFRDLLTALSTASSVGRMNIHRHVDFRKMEKYFTNQKQYSNLCTYFAVKD